MSSCPKCGTENAENAGYCRRCGSELRSHRPTSRVAVIAIGGIVAVLVIVVAIAIGSKRSATFAGITSHNEKTKEPTTPSGPSENLTHLATATASSWCSPSRKYGTDFVARNAIDGDPTTAWIEGAPKGNHGVGEWIMLTFSQPVNVTSVRILPGYARNVDDDLGDRWSKNNRVKRVRIEFDDGTATTAELLDQRSLQIMDVRASQVRSVKFVIRDVYPTPPEYGDDTAIGEIEVWGTR